MAKPTPVMRVTENDINVVKKSTAIRSVLTSLCPDILEDEALLSQIYHYFFSLANDYRLPKEIVEAIRRKKCIQNPEFREDVLDTLKEFKRIIIEKDIKKIRGLDNYLLVKKEKTHHSIKKKINRDYPYKDEVYITDKPPCYSKN